MVVVYVITIIIFLLILVNYYLGENLYVIPEDKRFFYNVNETKITRERNIGPAPSYVITISVATGILIGMYLAYASTANLGNNIIIILAIAAIFICYAIEITRNITLKDGTLTLSRFLAKDKVIKIDNIMGMYIYSYNKKFLNKHAYTTKLVITDINDKMTKFTLSSINNKAVLNMMKEDFGIINNKMYIAKR